MFVLMLKGENTTFAVILRSERDLLARNDGLIGRSSDAE